VELENDVISRGEKYITLLLLLLLLLLCSENGRGKTPKTGYEMESIRKKETR
jgi:hypothetical protein